MGKLKPTKRLLAVVAAGVLFITLLLIFVIRFVAVKDTHVHYHANFALYINGQRDEFKSFAFYEEEQACREQDPDDVLGRVHMHDQVNHLIHVHAHGVTWSQFFANLGYTLGDKVVATDSGAFVDGSNGDKLTFILNGQPVTTIADKVINSEDVLLINYGNEDSNTINSRYQAIPRDAHAANTDKDPAACGGAAAPTSSQKLKQALEFWQ